MGSTFNAGHTCYMGVNLTSPMRSKLVCMKHPLLILQQSHHHNKEDQLKGAFQTWQIRQRENDSCIHEIKWLVENPLVASSLSSIYMPAAHVGLL